MYDRSNRIDVWLFVTALSVGGAERTLVDLANGLDHDRYDVTVWTIFEQNPLAGRLSEDVTFRTLGVEGVTSDDHAFAVERAANPLTYVTAPLRFLRIVRRERPDILQSFLTYDNLVARAARVVAPGTKVVTGVRLVPTGEHDIAQHLDNLTTRFADHVVSNSQSGKEFVSRYRVPERRVSVVNNGRDLDRFDRDPPAGFRESLGVPADARIVGTVGRLIDRKGHGELLDAWATVRQEVPDAHLLIVGDGPERSALEAKATSLGIRSSVHFAGLRDDVPDCLAAMDVFVFPSHYEGFPGALLEAMAAGLPCVATPVDGNSELLGAYESGLFFDPGDYEAMANALVLVLTHPEVATDLGEAARERAHEGFDVSSMVAGFEAMYEQVLKADELSGHRENWR
ncbi:Glycosyltransferase [Halapricum desulfuricans]|uniref:Glycosyltransferase n=1 Tax=Halapricum desulfuricans TaxID=2841257 RepID=A0A897NKG1_9EURY|nr:glycosyltransferase [Halapricum desulfuricans]QSG11359.1 Glycosyltransferase [Halapricum desulfuricans]